MSAAGGPPSALRQAHDGCCELLRMRLRAALELLAAELLAEPARRHLAAALRDVDDLARLGQGWEDAVDRLLDLLREEEAREDARAGAPDEGVG
jgi:hypothetical protein